jgi:hypothetical protein
MIITDQNWQDAPQQYGILPRYLTYGSPEAREHGLTPFADNLDALIPWDEMKERVNLANERRQMPIHYLEACKAKPHSQGGTNYCWAYGLAMCLEALRPMESQEYCRLGPASLGWAVGWRNRGYYLSATIRAAMERGIAKAIYVPDATNDRREFTPGWEGDALNHKPHEFTDTDRSSEKFMAQQCASLLVAGLPLYLAFNWWGHAIAGMGVEWDESEKHNLRWINWNSHSDGRIEMTGSRGVPDEAYAVRVTTVSSTVTIAGAA